MQCKEAKGKGGIGNLGRNSREHGIPFSHQTTIPPKCEIGPRQQQARISTTALNIWTYLLNHLKPNHSSIHQKLIPHFHICHITITLQSLESNNKQTNNR